ncbi:MAG: response regulator [Verrucomicrobiales bacterium]
MLTKAEPNLEPNLSLSPGLVYIVDDELLIGEVVEAILNMEGFEAKVFGNPEEAYRSFADEPRKPDLLISDFVMTPMNGMELIERCKELQPGLKTILYSGNVGQEITSQYTTKPDGFMSKPFLPRTLITLVQSVLAGS